jgi:hypothetical protein
MPPARQNLENLSSKIVPVGSFVPKSLKVSSPCGTTTRSITVDAKPAKMQLTAIDQSIHRRRRPTL